MSLLRKKEGPEIILYPEEKYVYHQLFQVADEGKKGVIEGKYAADFLKKSNLSSTALSEIWNLADYENQGVLTTQTFIIAVKLIALVQNGQKPDMNLLKTKVPLPRFEGINVETGYIITDDIRENYRKSFLRLEPENGLVDGNKAREIFLRSKLSLETLRQIWKLADTNNRGKLDVNEFIIAMHLIKQYMNKNIKEIPQTLPNGFYEMVAGNSSSPLISPAARSFTDGFNTKSPFIEDSWDVTPEDKANYDNFFERIDEKKRGFLTGDEAANFFMKSKLNQATLAMIWDLSDIDKTGHLNHEKFAVAMYLIQKKLKGFPLPTILPTSLIPPSMRHTTENLFDLNDPTDLQNIFLSDKAVPKELPIIDLLGDPDINTKIAIESGEIKNYETQIDILSSSNDELKIQKNNLESTLANLIIQKQEFKDLFLQTRSLYEAEFKIVKEIQIQYQLENENLERAKGELAQAERALAAIKLEKEQLKENTQKDKDEINELKKKMRLVEEETVSIKAEIEKIQKENRQQKGLLEINKKQLATVEAEREKSLETLKNFEKSSNNSPDIDNVFVSTPSTITPTPSNNNSSDIFQSIFNEPEKESADFSNEQNENIFQQPPIENGATSTVDPFNSNNFKKPTSDKSAFDSAFATLEATNKTDDDPFLTDTFNSEKFPSLEELEGLTFAFENDFKFENDFNSDKKENNLFTDPKDETVVKQTEKSNATETKPNSSDEKVASPFMNEDKVENAFKNESTDLLKELMKPSTNTKDAHSSEDLDFIFTGLTEAKVMETTPPNTTVLDAAFGGTFEEAKAENNHEFEDAFGDFLKGNEIQKTQTNLEKVIKALEDSDYDLNKAIQILSPNN
ncbi:2162_t:CDS:10 [Entrophospora sp. SA101]|nr:2162_t:CDS:10 [Entrophospora sp. SA101]